jgi:hypothetical protein
MYRIRFNHFSNVANRVEMVEAVIHADTVECGPGALLLITNRPDRLVVKALPHGAWFECDHVSEPTLLQ